MSMQEKKHEENRGAYEVNKKEELEENVQWNECINADGYVGGPRRQITLA